MYPFTFIIVHLLRKERFEKSVLIKIFFSLSHNNADDSVFNKISEKRLIPVQIFIDDVFNIIFCEINFKLRSIQFSCCCQQFAKTAVKRFSSKIFCHTLSRNIKRIFDVVQHKSFTIIKYRTVIVFAVMFKHSDVVKVSVFVGNQCINFKKQSKIFTKLGQTCGFFYSINYQVKALPDSAFFCQNILVIRSQNPFKNMISGLNTLSAGKKVWAYRCNAFFSVYIYSFDRRWNNLV